MKIEINTMGFSLTEALANHVKKRIHYAFRAHATHIKCIIVRLSDINGPRGGYDKVCQIQGILPGHPDLIVEDVADDLYLAVNRAAARSQHSVARKLGKYRFRSKRSRDKRAESMTIEAFPLTALAER